MKYQALSTLAEAKVGVAEEALDGIEDLRYFGEAYAYDLAAIYVAFDDTENALHWLEKAISRYPEYPLLLETLFVDPRFDPLHDEPRFQKIISVLGFGES